MTLTLSAMLFLRVHSCALFVEFSKRRVSMKRDDTVCFVAKANQRPKHREVEADALDMIGLSNDDKINAVALKILDRYKTAFLELAK